MLVVKSLEELANQIETGKKVLFFTADWCGDCQFIKPQMPEIEENFKQFDFIQVDRDEFIEVAEKLMIMGIPSFVVLEDGKEVGRLVNRNRKTKEEIEDFLSQF